MPRFAPGRFNPVRFAPARFGGAGGFLLIDAGDGIEMQRLRQPASVLIGDGPYDGQTIVISAEDLLALETDPVFEIAPSISGTLAPDAVLDCLLGLPVYLAAKHPVTFMVQLKLDGVNEGAAFEATTTEFTVTLPPDWADEAVTIAVTVASDGDPTYATTVTSNTLSPGFTVPDQFAGGDWGVTDDHSGGAVTLSIAALPADGGSALTDLEYQLDGGAWVSLGSAATGDYPITGLTDLQEYDVAIRARNIAGAGPASTAKQVTPTATVEVSYLVVGGGGSGGIGFSTSSAGGGGSGGQVIAGTFDVEIDAYAITVGTKGTRLSENSGGTITQATASAAFGQTAARGETGGRYGEAGVSGYHGSGGGSASTATNPAGGTGSSGRNGGTGYGSATANERAGGGGAGAAAAGGNASLGVGGDGGVGVASSISGSSVTYGSGGGGATRSTTAANAGDGGTGAGNGGYGNHSTPANSDGGDATTAGSAGGGAVNSGGVPGDGADGIVIISYPTGAMTATGGTITTAGGNTIHSFTASGTFERTA